jgi:hypothetical protein
MNAHAEEYFLNLIDNNYFESSSEFENLEFIEKFLWSRDTDHNPLIELLFEMLGVSGRCQRMTFGVAMLLSVTGVIWMFS